MKKTIYLLTIMALSLLFHSCATATKSKLYREVKIKELADNPIFDISLAHQAPRFDSIKILDFKEAFTIGLAIQHKTFEEVLEDREAPSFENTILKIEESNYSIRKARILWTTMIGYGASPLSMSDSLSVVSDSLVNEVYGFEDKIFENHNFFQKINAVNQVKNKLSSSDKRLVEYYLNKAYAFHGNLNSTQRKQETKLIEQIENTSAKIDSLKIVHKEQGFWVQSIEDIDGLADWQIELSASLAKENGSKTNYLLPYHSRQLNARSILSSLKREEIRKRYFQEKEKSQDKLYKDNRDLTDQIDSLAIKKMQLAKLYGHKHRASVQLQGFWNGAADNYLNSAEEIIDFNKSYAKQAAIEKQKEDSLILQTLGILDSKAITIAPWNRYFYTNAYISKTSNDSVFTPYFTLDTVVEKGMFFLANKLFGLTFRLRNDLPKYHPDIKVYEVIEEPGNTLGLIYLDFFARENKIPMPSFTSFAEASTYYKQKPISGGMWSLEKGKQLTPADVISLFHDFTHGIHNLYAERKYSVYSGMFNTPQDFGEFPSQLFEFAAFHPDIIKNYAIHNETKETLSDSLIDELIFSYNFGWANAMYGITIKNMLSTKWHAMKDTDGFISSKYFEVKMMKNEQLFESNNAFSSYRYIDQWTNEDYIKGWPSGYHFNYTQYMAANAFEMILSEGGLNEKQGKMLKRLLALGNEKDMKKEFNAFLGRPPRIEHLFKYKFPLYKN